MTRFLTAFADELIKIAAKDTKTKSKKKSSLLRRAATLGLGAAAGYGAYRYARKVRLSKDPLLRRMQEKSKGRMSLVDVEQPGMELLPRPPKGVERVFRGGDELVRMPVGTAGERAEKVIAGKAEPRKFKGAISTAADPHELRGIKSDLALTTSPEEIVSGSLYGKLKESKYLAATGSGAKSESTLSYLKTVRDRKPKTYEEALDMLQEELAKKYPKGYVVKPLAESYAPGVPTHKQRFADILGPKGNPEHRKWMKGLMTRPNEYMVQEYVPIAKQRAFLSRPPVKPGEQARKLRLGAEVPTEYRVHVYGGKVIPGASVHRWSSGGMNPARRREIKEMERAIQKAVNKLPENRMHIPMAMDVAKTTGGEWKIIEGNIGTQSGYMGQQFGIPVPSRPAHALYKAVTGRSSQLEAGAKALAAGAGTSLVAGKVGRGGIPPEA